MLACAEFACGQLKADLLNDRSSEGEFQMSAAILWRSARLDISANLPL